MAELVFENVRFDGLIGPAPYLIPVLASETVKVIDWTPDLNLKYGNLPRIRCEIFVSATQSTIEYPPVKRNIQGSDKQLINLEITTPGLDCQLIIE